MSESLPQWLLFAGLALLAIEALVLGFSTFILLFLGLSLILTGVATWLGVLSPTWVSVLISNALVTALLGLVLWRPLKKLQNKTEKNPVKSDFDGHRFFTPAPVVKNGEPCRYDFSGVTWHVKSDRQLESGVEVEVVRVEVGVLWVKPV
jgi:inner membrane protein